MGRRYALQQNDKLGHVSLNDNNIVVRLPSHALDPYPPGRPPPYSPAIAEALSQYDAIVDYFNTLSPVPVSSYK